MTGVLTTGTAPHACHAPKCDVEVELDRFMCPAHWFVAPPPLREAIQGSYRPGQEVDKQAFSEYLALAHAAIDAVAHQESCGAPRKARPALKPVQRHLGYGMQQASSDFSSRDGDQDSGGASTGSTRCARSTRGTCCHD